VKHDLRIDVLGTSFSISADEDPVYLETLLNRYRLVIENTQKITGLDDPLKISIIAGFLLCDELQKMSNQNPAIFESHEAEEIAGNLIGRLERALKDVQN
jgi:cell division protein ZapA (FtsZ GTPase activity inhibitor)